MRHLFSGLDLHTEILLLLALIFALFYEVINGFHDTANAVATVIYTRAMKSQLAVIMAAIFNFFGVLFGGLSVAYSIVHMLPINLLLNISSHHGLVMVFSLLLTAIIWNLSTWYLSLPTSSSHSLIGAIIGIGITNALLTNTSIIDALNFSKVFSILFSLILSPIIGLVVAGGLIFILCQYWRNTKRYTRMHLTPIEREEQDGKKKPPFWIRVALILSAIGMAFSHGANDGQKGIGLVMLTLISIAPTGFAVNMNSSNYEITRTRDALNSIETYFTQHKILLEKVTGVEQFTVYLKVDRNTLSNSNKIYYYSSNIANTLKHTKEMLTNIESYIQLTVEQRSQIRHVILCTSDIINRIINLPEVNNNDQRLLRQLKSDMLNTIEYAPIWIIVIVALALGIGTMIGWRRVAITIGEKIGRKGMSYAQGVSAQLTAAISIFLASYTGIPVSTTHVLSSSLAGTMIVSGSGLQKKTITSILMAWMITLPASIIISGGLYWLILNFFN